MTPSQQEAVGALELMAEAGVQTMKRPHLQEPAVVVVVVEIVMEATLMMALQEEVVVATVPVVVVAAAAAIMLPVELEGQAAFVIPFVKVQAVAALEEIMVTPMGD